MTICQFFLQGRCRYGQNCRFEHSYNNDDRSNKNTASTQELSNVIKQIVGEVILAEKGGQWPLSCYSPVKEGANISGWEDISPEEVRWKMYEARANGTLNQCINEINQLYNNAEKNRNILKQPTMERINLIVNVLKGKKETHDTTVPFASSSTISKTEFRFDSSPTTNIFCNSGQSISTQRNMFGNGTQAPVNSGGIFGNPLQSPNAQENIFGRSTQFTGNQGNIFGGNSQSFTNQNIFGGSNSSTSFNQNVFSNTQSTNQGIFPNTTVRNGNIFSSTSISTQNIFSNVPTSVQANQNPQPNTSPPTINSKIFSNQGSNTPIFGTQNSCFQKNGNQIQSSIFTGNQNENILKNQNLLTKNDGIFNSPQSNEVNFGNQAQLSVVINQHRPNAIDSSIYSKLEDLNEEEIKSFTAPTFVFGKIPLKPPPQEYCN